MDSLCDDVSKAVACVFIEEKRRKITSSRWLQLEEDLVVGQTQKIESDDARGMWLDRADIWQCSSQSIAEISRLTATGVSLTEALLLVSNAIGVHWQMLACRYLCGREVENSKYSIH